MKNTDRIKYYIHDAIKSVLPDCKNPADLRFALEKHGIEIDYKFKRGSNEIQGVSFKYENIAFKGSEIDRKCSFGNLKKEFQKNLLEENRRTEDAYLRQQAEQKAKLEADERARKEAETNSQTAKRNLVVKGVKLSDEQKKTLMDGGYIFLKNMTAKDGKTQFSAYAFLNDEKKRVLLTYDNPDEFVKYGKYEMRIRDKILIENGYITKAKVKWFGGVNYAYPYLWKANKFDTDYQESWSDPRLPKTQKEEQKPKQPIVQQKNRGRKR